jgi:TonB family protein
MVKIEMEFMGTCHLIKFAMPLLITAIVTGCAVGPSSPQIKTSARADPDQAYRQLDFYPRVSRELSEQGSCSVEVQVGINGIVGEAKIIDSTGYSTLDEGCVAAAKARRFIPATVGGRVVVSRTIFPIKWTIKGQIGPFVKENEKLHIGPDYYPEVSRRLHQEGDCLVNIMVDADGKPSEATILQSTGFPALDQACLIAAEGAEYTPGFFDGVRSKLNTHVFLSWRLTP